MTHHIAVRTLAGLGVVALAAVAAPISPAGAVGQTADRSYTAFSACMKRNGVTLPAKAPGRPTTKPGTGTGTRPASPQIAKPKNVSRAKFNKAMRVCKPLLPVPGSKSTNR